MNSQLLSKELRDVVEIVFDGWYADANRIDWEDFLDRVESLSKTDLGNDMLSPTIKEIKAYVRYYKTL